MSLFTPEELKLLRLSDAAQDGERNPRLAIHKPTRVPESQVVYGRTGVRRRIRQSEAGTGWG